MCLPNVDKTSDQKTINKLPLVRDVTVTTVNTFWPTTATSFTPLDMGRGRRASLLPHAAYWTQCKMPREDVEYQRTDTNCSDDCSLNCFLLQQQQLETNQPTDRHGAGGIQYVSSTAHSWFLVSVGDEKHLIQTVWSKVSLH